MMTIPEAVQPLITLFNDHRTTVIAVVGGLLGLWLLSILFGGDEDSGKVIAHTDRLTSGW
ncbi:MAG TPA: hypothetical protein EYO39_05210 [Nitrospirales bacterium]|jgi:hypothetical protein|nr:hypothetical protein [Nitrospirales bacterium]